MRPSIAARRARSWPRRPMRRTAVVALAVLTAVVPLAPGAPAAPAAAASGSATSHETQAVAARWVAPKGSVARLVRPVTGECKLLHAPLDEVARLEERQPRPHLLVVQPPRFRHAEHGRRRGILFKFELLRYARRVV